MRYIAFLILLVLSAVGCSPAQKSVEVHESETVSRTIWTAKTELFMEYDEPKLGKKAGFLIHLTDLKDFKPVTEGPLVLSFAPAQGEPVEVTIEKPARPGIFKTEVTFRHPGVHTLTMLLKGNQVSDEILVPDIAVAGEGVVHEDAHHEGPSGGDISFLKEQQWTIDFMAGLPVRQPVSSSFVVTGEVIPAANAEAVISSPLAGILSLSQQLPYSGKKVTMGEVMAVIESPVSLQGGMGSLTASYAEAKNRVILAQKEYERAQRLYEAKAVPKRRLEEAELGLQSAKAALEPLERAVQEVKQSDSENRVVIRAPFSGTVVELLAAKGKAIDAGQPVLKLLNTSSVWLSANVPAAEIGRLGNLGKATFTVPGIDGEMKPSRLVTVNEVVDPRTRTVPVIFEVNNRAGKLKVGMFADVSIKSGNTSNALTLPDEALFEDEGRFFVFVQQEGESFERREVKTGVKGNGIVEIVSGLSEDERVVLRGGYYVKLASLSSRMPQGHGHDH